jgi:DNA mismatch endonuclease, patch repair protein
LERRKHFSVACEALPEIYAGDGTSRDTRSLVALNGTHEVKLSVVDKLSKEHRSELMARVSGRDSKPEWILRCALHRLGFRYRLGGSGLRGRPDLVFPKYHTVVFVHGCFWHQHVGCKRSGLPTENATFWLNKLAGNVSRDHDNVAALEQEGWKVIIVWECELYADPVAAVMSVVSELMCAAPEAATAQGNDLLDGALLLRIAEKKRRYRIGSRMLTGKKQPGERSGDE